MPTGRSCSRWYAALQTPTLPLWLPPGTHTAQVRTCAAALSIPMFVKIRLLDTREETIRFCEQLRDAGASLIAIHARHRVNLVGRTGPGAREGAAKLDWVAQIRAVVRGVRIVSNGNVTCWQDAVANLKLTGADGVMSAEVRGGRVL